MSPPAEDEIVLEGKDGDAGGKLLREAVAVSLCTRRPFRLSAVRAEKEPAGLRPHHLAFLRAVEALSGSRVEGAAVGATAVAFFPGAVRPGDYQLDLGPQGSASLALPALFFPFALAGGGTLTLRGGTHLPDGPGFPWLAKVWPAALRAFGFSAHLSLRNAGFPPDCAGELRVRAFERAPAPDRIEIPARGTLRDVEVNSFVANLPFDVAERQGRSAVAALRERGIHAHAENLPLPTVRSTGSAVFVSAEFENSVAGFTAYGEKGKRAEVVGREAAEALSDFLEGAGSVDPLLAESLLLPAALLAAGLLGPSQPGTTRFSAPSISMRMEASARLLRKLLPVEVELGSEGDVRVSPRPAG